MSAATAAQRTLSGFGSLPIEGADVDPTFVPTKRELPQFTCSLDDACRAFATRFALQDARIERLEEENDKLKLTVAMVFHFLDHLTEKVGVVAHGAGLGPVSRVQSMTEDDVQQLAFSQMPNDEPVDGDDAEDGAASISQRQQTPFRPPAEANNAGEEEVIVDEEEKEDVKENGAAPPTATAQSSAAGGTDDGEEEEGDEQDGGDDQDDGEEQQEEEEGDEQDGEQVMGVTLGK